MTDRRIAQAATEGQPEPPALSEARAGEGGAPAEAPTVRADATSPAAARPPSLALSAHDREVIRAMAHGTFVAGHSYFPGTTETIMALAREAEGRLAGAEATEAAVRERHAPPVGGGL